jgi:hypothetical protein
MIAYTVRCEIADRTVAEEWLEWMRGDHLAAVVAAGAREGVVVQLDGEPSVCEARYLFDDRAAFERYEREEAPRLRADGLTRFPPERGIRYGRTVGVVVTINRR